MASPIRSISWHSAWVSLRPISGIPTILPRVWMCASLWAATGRRTTISHNALLQNENRASDRPIFLLIHIVGRAFLPGIFSSIHIVSQASLPDTFLSYSYRMLCISVWLILIVGRAFCPANQRPGIPARRLLFCCLHESRTRMCGLQITNCFFRRPGIPARQISLLFTS